MHSISFVGAALLALSSVVSAAPAASSSTKKATSTASGDVCTHSPYATYLPLSEFHLATEYCTSAYPLPCSGSAGQSAIVKTTTKTTSATHTVTVEAAPALETVTTGGKVTATVRTTVTPNRSTHTSTVTHIIDVGLNSIVGIHLKREPATTSAKSVNTASLSSMMNRISWFAGRDSSFYKTLCSCIETTPGCAQKTSIFTVTEGVTATVTQTHTSTNEVDVKNTAVTTKKSTITAATPVTTKTVTTNVFVSAGVTLLR